MRMRVWMSFVCPISKVRKRQRSTRQSWCPAGARTLADAARLTGVRPVRGDLGRSCPCAPLDRSKPCEHAAELDLDVNLHGVALDGASSQSAAMHPGNTGGRDAGVRR